MKTLAVLDPRAAFLTRILDDRKRGQAVGCRNLALDLQTSIAVIVGRYIRNCSGPSRPPGHSVVEAA